MLQLSARTRSNTQPCPAHFAISDSCTKSSMIMIDMRGGLVDADARSIESACRITASRHVSTNRMISKKRGPFACHPSLRLFIFSHLMADFVPCCPASEQQLGVSCSFFLSWSSFDRSRQYCRVDCTSAHAILRGLRYSTVSRSYPKQQQCRATVSTITSTKWKYSW